MACSKGSCDPCGSPVDPCSPLCLAVGKPIEVQKTLQPTEEEVNRLHQHYMEELCSLFEAHKLKFNIPADQHLEFC